ncbi:MAG: hypothetical protein KZQ73_03935 [Candidatus Thiodiazotropha sp. (ex Semelilucina semeliformis)]|nr:hypothetical protein [Candidatus Thiodiazotropha sp. (ex Semelilucina semeliformis)]
MENDTPDTGWRYYRLEYGIGRLKGTIFDCEAQVFYPNRGEWVEGNFLNIEENGSMISGNELQEWEKAFDAPIHLPMLIENKLVACQLSIPHSDPKECTSWATSNGDSAIVVRTPAFDLKTGAANMEAGLPFGKFAKASLLYIDDQITNTQSSVIDLGSDKSLFASEIGVANGWNFREISKFNLIDYCHVTLRFASV